VFIYRAFKHCKELWRVKHRAWSGRLKNVRDEAAIQTVWERIHWCPFWKQKIMSRKWTYPPNQIMPHQGWCAHESAPPFEGTPPYSCSEGNLTDKSRASPPVAHRERARKHPFHGWKFSPTRSSITNRTTRFMLKLPLRCVLRVQGGHHPSYIMVWWEVSHQGVTHFHFCKKGVKLVSECIKRTCYKELWNSLTWLSSVVRNGSSSRTQFVPKRPRQLRSDCGETFWPSSESRFGFRGVQTSKPWTVKCGLFWRTWCAKSYTTAWRTWGDPLWRQQQRSPWKRSVRRQQSGRSILRLALRHRAAILCDIITN